MHLYLAPAACGKTAYLIGLARQLSLQLQETPRVVVSSRLQARAWRQRLAAEGGALGVKVGTFDMLYRDILAAAGETYTLIGDPVQFRLVRKVIEENRLVHYESLQAMPGFVQVISDLIRELKATGITPEALAAALGAAVAEPRLTELADLYLAYQKILQEYDWADYAGMGWLAAEALERELDVGLGWSPVLVDGFDDVTTVQLRVLTLLSQRAKNLIVTLTGMPDGSVRYLVHRRFNRTRERLEEALGTVARPLPDSVPIPHVRPEPLVYLEANFLERAGLQVPAGDVVRMVAAPDRPGEVREALRWLKERLVLDGMKLREVALLARKLSPYRAFIVQTAHEFGLPVQLVDGYPLKGNPAVAALLDLLRLSLPSRVSVSEMAPPLSAHQNTAAPPFPWRAVVAAWRSPYFDWRFASSDNAAHPEGALFAITLHDAEVLDRLARWASVVGGLDQWNEAFDLVSAAASTENRADDEWGFPSNVPTGASAVSLRQKFQAFVERVSPPPSEAPLPCREFVAWLETLIGNFEDFDELSDPAGPGPNGVGLARCIENGPTHLRERDTAALNALKDVLRGLVWADEAVGCEPVGFARFFTDLVGAVEAAVYRPPLSAREEAVLVTDVAAARGLSFRAVAILGLAEGEFPAALSEDPLLRDRDRRHLRDDHGFALNLSSDSAEAGYFYEAFTRATNKLLLTRPRVADNGAAWQASPYWDEVCRWLAVQPVELTSGHSLEVVRAASQPEVVFAVADLWETVPDVKAWLLETLPERCASLTTACAVVHQRMCPDSASNTGYEGGLLTWAAAFSRRYAPERIWSASRLEIYTACPFWFFIGHALGLEPRQPPLEGLDARQLGNIYHHIFEELYHTASDPADLDQLLEALPAVAEVVLDQAPRREQFRPTAWWVQTRTEIVENVRRSLEALHALGGDYLPHEFEAAFGLDGKPPLIVRDGGDHFELRGFIDRVDRDPSGRIRVIDYKTAAKNKFTAAAVRDGKKLQLPLYALAAQDALELGEVADGFYWHVHQAEPSSLRLARYDGGAVAAMVAAVEHAWAAVRGARLGAFRPAPPVDGCPSYCAASGFCWHYRPGR